MDWIKREARVEAISAREQLECKSRAVDVRFKAVRLGLSFAITVLLLLAFCLIYVRPQEAAFYPLILALCGDGIFLVTICAVARQTKRQYYEVLAEAKRMAASPGGPKEET